MKAFVVNRKVRFSDTDGAGIVFYPRYFEMISAVIEDWFGGPLEVPFSQLHGPEKSAIPLVDIHCKFFAASRLEDDLKFELIATKIGRASMSLQIDVSCQGQQRLQVNMIIVYANAGDGNLVSKPLPNGLRKKMLQFLNSPTQMETTS